MNYRKERKETKRIYVFFLKDNIQNIWVVKIENIGMS